MIKKTKDSGLIGVVLVTHTDFGARLLKAAEFILGPQEQCDAISVDVTHEVEITLANLKEAVHNTDKGKGVAILTDMFGGTPTNLSLSLLGAGNIDVITGVNLPMLLKVLTTRSGKLTELAELAKQAGVQGIVAAGELLRSKVQGQ